MTSFFVLPNEKLSLQFLAKHFLLLFTRVFFITPGENLGISRVNFLEFMYEPYNRTVYTR